MRTFWMSLHLIGFTLWIGGGIATMAAGIVAKRFAPEARLAGYRITSAVWRVLIGPAVLAEMASGIALSQPYMKSGEVPGWLGLMMGTGLVAALVALGVALPAAAALGNLQLDAKGALPARFAAVRARLVWAASISGGLALVGLIAGAAYRAGAVSP
jgi:hypothetical protein